MGAELSGVNHLGSPARDMDETVKFYAEVLDVGVRRIANDEPGSKHYCFDIGGPGTLDFFEAKEGVGVSDPSQVGTLNHLAITSTPAFIDTVEERLKARSLEYRATERGGQRTIYFMDPNGINLQLYPSTGGTRG